MLPGPLSVPRFFSIELCSDCNNRCSGCGNVFGHSQDYLALDSWQKIFKKITPHVLSIKITGGEPTLHPQFSEIIMEVDRIGVPFSVFTNGRWANPNKLLAFLAKLSYFDGLLVSLHGSNASMHEFFTNVRGSFSETINNIRLAVKYGLRVHVSTVITSVNFDQLRKVANIARKSGAQKAVFNRFLGSGNNILEPDVAQLGVAIHSIEEMINEWGDGYDETFGVRYGNCIPQCFSSSMSTGCWAGLAYCTIDPWGKIRPCNHSPLILGNILEMPLDAIWHNSLIEKWRGLIPKHCISCVSYDVCHGGCRALAEIHASGEDPLIGKHLPQIASKQTEILLSFEARPILRGQIHPETFGFVLIHGQSLLAVKPEAKEILDVLNGHFTLQDIYHSYDQEGIDFVGQLILSGFVEL